MAILYSQIYTTATPLVILMNVRTQPILATAIAALIALTSPATQAADTTPRQGIKQPNAKANDAEAPPDDANKTEATDQEKEAKGEAKEKEPIAPRHDPLRKRFLEGKLAFWFKDYTKAKTIWEALSKENYAEADATLAWMYHEGIGVPQDYKQAAEWYRRAAEQGIVTAQTNLGVFYENGWGVEQDYKQAAEWYSKAATLGYEHANYNLALLYLDGKGVEKNRELAINLLFLAYRFGIADAKDVLESIGVTVNEEETIKHTTPASAPAQPGAQSNDPAENDKPVIMRHNR